MPTRPCDVRGREARSRESALAAVEWGWWWAGGGSWGVWGWWAVAFKRERQRRRSSVDGGGRFPLRFCLFGGVHVDLATWDTSTDYARPARRSVCVWRALHAPCLAKRFVSAMVQFMSRQFGDSRTLSCV